MDWIIRTDKKTGRIHTCSPEEVKDYIKNEYPGLYQDLEGTIKGILDGAVIEPHHDIFVRPRDDKEVIKFFETQIKWRKGKTDKELWLGDLQNNIFPAIKPYLGVSELTIKYIETKIKDALKA